MESCHSKRHDGNLVATRDTTESCHHKKTRCPLVATKKSGVGVLICGCKFSTCTCLRHDGIVSPQETRCPLVATKKRRQLILNWFRTGGNDLIGRRRGIQRQGETDRQKSLWIENAARHRNRDVSPDGVHPTRAENIPPIPLRSHKTGGFASGNSVHDRLGMEDFSHVELGRRLRGCSTRRPHEIAGWRHDVG